MRTAILGSPTCTTTSRRSSSGSAKPGKFWATPGATPPEAPPADPEEGAEPAASTSLSPDEVLLEAQRLFMQARYFEAIQILEAALPRFQQGRQQNRGRIMLARALAKNKLWIHRAEETLQGVVRED